MIVKQEEQKKYSNNYDEFDLVILCNDIPDSTESIYDIGNLGIILGD